MKFSKILQLSLCAFSIHLSASTPEFIGNLEFGANFPLQGIAILGTTGYLSSRHGLIESSGYFDYFDAQNSIAGTISLPSGDNIIYERLAVSGGTLYGLTNQATINTNFTSAVLALDQNLNPVSQVLLDQIYRNLTISGTALYLSTLTGKPPYKFPGYISVFDITKMEPYQSAGPTISQIYTVQNKPLGMDVSNDILYVTDYDGFVNYYNKFPDAPLGSFSALGTPTDIQIVGTTAFVSCLNGINYFDISDNNNFIGSITLSDTAFQSLAFYENSIGYVVTGSVGRIPRGGTYSVAYFSTGYNPGPTPSNLTQAGGGNGAAIAGMLNQLNGNCPQATQGIIDFLSVQNQPDQINDLNELAPAFKILQFTLEKLDLLLQKELDDSLYGRQKGNVPFLIAGYNNLTQLKNKPYNGYTSNDCYQLLGMTGSFEKARWMAGVGASESWANTKPQKAHASYNTVWGTLGFSKMRHRYQIGIKGLFGYSFINANRTITFLNEKAKTNHGAYNISVDGRFSLVYRFGKTQVTPYDNLGYIYGHENNYTENGAPGANLHISNEQISMLRNSLGLSLDTVAYKHVKFFLDGAWVYDHNFKSTKYNGSFIGTDVTGIFNQTQPTSNFGRAQLGFMNDRDDFTWRLCYTGLFGKKFYDNAISLKLAYKF